MNREGKSQKLFIILASILILGLILKLAQDIILTLLISIFISFIMELPVSLLKKIKFPFWLAVVTTALIYLGIFVIIGLLFYTNIIEFGKNLPQYIEKLYTMLSDVIESVNDFLSKMFKMEIKISFAEIPVVSYLLPVANSIISSLPLFSIIYFLSILIIWGKSSYSKKFKYIFPNSKTLTKILYQINNDVKKYIAVKVLSSICLGIGISLIALLFDIRFIIIWGVLAFLLNFIPILGPTLAAILPAVIALIQKGDFFITFWIFICLLVYSTLIGSLLEPKLQGNAFNLSLFTVFFCILFWSWLWGIAGALLAVPLTTAIKIIIEHIPSISKAAIFFEKPFHLKEKKKDS